MVNKGFMNADTDNVATNSNSENARSRMVASLLGSVGTVTKKIDQVTGAFGPLDLAMLRPVLAWRAFLKLTNRLFLQLYKFFSGRGNPQINETADKGLSLYCVFLHSLHIIVLS